MLSTKESKKAWVDLVRDDSAQDGYRFEVKTGEISKEEEKEKKRGSKLVSEAGKARGFFCVLTGVPISLPHIREQGKQQKLRARLMAVVAKSAKGRVYLTPTKEQESMAEIEKPDVPDLDVEIPVAMSISVPPYGITRWQDLFTARQLTTLQIFSNLIDEVREQVFHYACAAPLPDDDRPLDEGGIGATAYADAVATYLSFSIDRMADYNSSACSWHDGRQTIRNTFPGHSLPMSWSFAEANPFSSATGSFESSISYIVRVIGRLGNTNVGSCYQADAPQSNYPIRSVIIATDPPYYDNIGFADLSDFFYVWLRRSLRSVWPSLFRRVLTPKEQELIATRFRHKNKKAAEQFFMKGMGEALKTMHDAAVEDAPVAVYYAFKQSEVAKEGVTSAGWASFLQAVINAGFIVDGTWPIRTELPNKVMGLNAAVLASSIVLVCIKRSKDAPTMTRREFIPRLKEGMRIALKFLQDAKVHPVDMAQASIGPGIGVFSRYAKILQDDDSEMTVRDAIAQINGIRDEILSEEDAEYDPKTRFCIDWFRSFGMQQEKAGTAIAMAQAYNLGLEDLDKSGVFLVKKGQASLIPREKMSRELSPGTDDILTHWECTQHLIRVLQSENGSAKAAGDLLARMNEKGDIALKLAHRLYHICERQNWAHEALGYNQLAQEFPSIEEYASQAENNQQLEQKELLE